MMLLFIPKEKYSNDKLVQFQQDKTTMTFINEYISTVDKKRYDIDNINKKYIAGGVSSQWTIDRDRKIYLREVSAGIGHSGKNRIWNFFWNDTLIELKIEILSSGGERGAFCWAHKKIHDLQLPHILEANREEILSDLKEALTAYKDGGVFATATTYNLILELTIE